MRVVTAIDSFKGSMTSIEAGLAVAGGVTEDAKECNKNGIDAFFPIVRGIMTLEEAMDKANAQSNLCATAEQVMRLMMTRVEDRKDEMVLIQ